MPTPQTLTELIFLTVYYVQLIIPVIVALALLFFLWGLMVVLFGVPDNKDEIKKAKNRMVWGVIVLFIMLSVGGILYVFERTFGFGGYSYGSSYGPYRGEPGLYQTPGTIIRTSGGGIWQKAPPNEFRLCLFNRVGINCPKRIR